MLLNGLNLGVLTCSCFPQDYDLCITCYNTKNHDHKMEKLTGWGLMTESNNQQAAATAEPRLRLSIQRCIQSLVHACQCRSANCSLRPAQKMKRVVQHTRAAKRKTNGGCPICKQLMRPVLHYHAKHCQENKCPVPFCLNIKQKLQQQQLQHGSRPRCCAADGQHAADWRGGAAAGPALPTPATPTTP